MALRASTIDPDLLWRALADPSRRQILDLLRDGPRTTGDLAQRFGDVTRFSVMKHLKLLVEAGLVIVTWRGRERLNWLNTAPIRDLQRRWVSPLAAAAGDRLSRLKGLAEQLLTGDVQVTKRTFAVVELSVEVAIAAPRTKVWQALVQKTKDWWPADFYTGAGPRGMHIEPKPGGRMFEDWGGGGGRVWATVTTVRADELLELSGELSPEFGGPARALHRFELSDAAGGGTRLRFSDCVYGAVSDASTASLEAGWRRLLEECLKPFAESGRRPQVPPSVA